MTKFAYALTLAAVFCTGAHAAGSVDQTIDVKVSLAAKCVANNAANPLIDFGTYTAFGSASTAAPTANVFFKCSRGLAPTAAFVGSGYTIAGLNYTLGVDAGTKTAAVLPATDYDAWKYVVTGGMVAGQAGDSAAALTDAQVLRISF